MYAELVTTGSEPDPAEVVELVPTTLLLVVG